MAHSKILVIGILVAVIIAIGSVFMFMPPFFVQFGTHYFAGTEVANAGWYYCNPPDDFDNCEPIRESFASAVSRDPHLQNWWPIRPEIIRLDESYE